MKYDDNNNNKDTVFGGFIASPPLTPLVKPRGVIRPTVVGTVWWRLVSKVGVSIVGKTLHTYFEDFQFGVSTQGGGEAILNSVNRLVECKGDVVGISMLLVDFQNAFNLVDTSVMLQPVRLYYSNSILWSCQGVQQDDPLSPLLFSLILHPLVLKIHQSCKLNLQAWYLDDGTIVRDTLMVAKALNVIKEEEPSRCLFLNLDKTELFWPREDPRSREDGVFPPNISRPCVGVKLLGGPVSTDQSFCRGFSLKRVSKTIELMTTVSKLHDLQCELLLLRYCVGVGRLFYALRTCPSDWLGDTQVQFDLALCSSLEKIVTASEPGFGDWLWRLATLPIKRGGLGIYSTDYVINYAFLTFRL
ncbi:uncharacterized protein LOC130825888 [Amaranthus tricolor]|uniref:uncharacterized protein LOC130825888 n=1 Tax=Amaranthus tricolor TaxID=29722 RepID=UPI0025852CA2|nr:uncharacterized protein LOC130825888 [Amaranthus tricolor]